MSLFTSAKKITKHIQLQQIIHGKYDTRTLIPTVLLSFGCIIIPFFVFNGISTLMEYLMPKPFLRKSSTDTILPIARGIKGFIPFPRIFLRKGI